MTDAFWIALFGAVAAVMSAAFSYRNGKKSDDINQIVNSQRTVMQDKIAELETMVRQLTNQQEAFRAGQASSKAPPAV